MDVWLLVRPRRRPKSLRTFSFRATCEVSPFHKANSTLCRGRGAKKKKRKKSLMSAWIVCVKETMATCVALSYRIGILPNTRRHFIMYKVPASACAVSRALETKTETHDRLKWGVSAMEPESCQYLSRPAAGPPATPHHGWCVHTRRKCHRLVFCKVRKRPNSIRYAYFSASILIILLAKMRQK